MVPLDALKASRAEAKQAKEAAREADALRQQVAQMQGALSTFQQLQQTLQRPQAPAQPQPEADPKLVEYARSLDYYKQDGTPDTDRAAKFAQLVRSEAQTLAQQALAPMREIQHRDLSARNFQQAVQGTVAGVKPKAETLSWMWQNLPAELTADPRTAQVLQVLALGIDTASGQAGHLPPAPAPPANPPPFTEGTSAPTRRAQPISDLERLILADKGITEAKYQELTKGFRPGRTNTLED